MSAYNDYSLLMCKYIYMMGKNVLRAQQIQNIDSYYAYILQNTIRFISAQ